MSLHTAINAATAQTHINHCASSACLVDMTAEETGCGLWRCHLCKTRTSGKSTAMETRRQEAGKRHELSIYTPEGACGKMWKFPEARRNGNGP
eukprot:361038-Chlamydomonas_euryale.AAC.1